MYVCMYLIVYCINTNTYNIRCVCVCVVMVKAQLWAILGLCFHVPCSPQGSPVASCRWGLRCCGSSPRWTCRAGWRRTQRGRSARRPAPAPHARAAPRRPGGSAATRASRRPRLRPCPPPGAPRLRGQLARRRPPAAAQQRRRQDGQLESGIRAFLGFNTFHFGGMHT